MNTLAMLHLYRLGGESRIRAGYGLTESSTVKGHMVIISDDQAVHRGYADVARHRRARL